MAIQDFTRDPQVLLNFIRSVSDTHGGDAPECYEYVLRQVRTKLTWRDGMLWRQYSTRHFMLPLFLSLFKVLVK